MLLPLVPSVHPSALGAGADAGRGERQAFCLSVLARDQHLCQFCGLPAGDWQDVFHCNNDHDDWAAANLAAACPLCHGVQHIGDPEADQVMRVIWLPEITQNALNVLVRGIHLTLHAHGVAPSLAERPIVADTPVICAWRAYAALDRRAGLARSVIDTDRPGDLAAGLSTLAEDRYRARARLLGGLRLLHRGRCLRGNRDVYPDHLASWAKHPSPPPSV